MKSEDLIRENLSSKLGIWIGDERARSERLKEHIIMLDWVLSDCILIRDIDEIIEEAEDKIIQIGDDEDEN